MKPRLNEDYDIAYLCYHCVNRQHHNLSYWEQAHLCTAKDKIIYGTMIECKSYTADFEWIMKRIIREEDEKKINK